MSRTFEQMIDELRIRINSHIEQHTAVFTAVMADQRRYHLGVRNVVPGSLRGFYYDNGEWYQLSQQPTCDYVPGWVILHPDTLVERGSQFRFDCEYSRTPIELLYSWLNAGINALWPEFYILRTEVVSAQVGVMEYDWPTGAENVTKVEFRSTGSGRWVDNNRWDHADGETKVKFYAHPGIGDIRMTYVVKPVGAASIENETDDFCTETGLPEQAIEAVMLYMEFRAAEHNLTVRATSNASVNYSITATRTDDAIQSAQMLYQAFVAYKKAVAMPPFETTMRVPL